MKEQPNRWATKPRIGFWLGLLLFGATLLTDLVPGEPAVTRMAAIAVLMATWWISEAIPLYATALLPLFLYPLLGIERTAAVAPVYFNSTIVLFLGAFMIALTMEKWGLHRRIGLSVIRAVGGGPARLILGFMLAAGLLSMWISNTATTLMMVPVGLAVILRLEEKRGVEQTRRFSVALMLGIAYACTAGGITTVVGTPPNLAFRRIFEITFPEAPSISFAQWLLLAFPIGAILLVVAWWLLTKVFFPVDGLFEGTDEGSAGVSEELKALGRTTWEERVVLTIFGCTALLWVFRVPIVIGGLEIPGWSSLLPSGGLIDDGTIAIAMAALLFLIPARTPGAESRAIAEAQLVRRLPWNIVLLFGGGFALAHGFQATGLAQFVAEGLGAMASVPPLALVFVLAFAVTFLTELTSNTATAELLLPILAAIGVSAGIHPLLLMVPATLSTSCAFMMPVATPPNAVVFGSQRVTVSQMARVGLVLNFVGIGVITILMWTLGRAIFGIELGEMPDWARTSP